MIIVKLIGGLGNQMFQYALGRKLSHTKKYPFKLDISWYKNKEFGPDITREYSLGHFNVIENFATDQEIAKFAYKKEFFYRLATKIKREVFGIGQIGFDRRVFATPDNSHLDGFWQSEKYFSDIRDILLREFTLKTGFSPAAEEIAKQEADADSVSLHIRRGDYVTDKRVVSTIGSCDMGYYRRAVDIIKKKIVQPVFFIYSDDIAWVRENLRLEAPAVYVSRPEFKDYEELTLMSRCKHNIVANSSFSWWGAWLNQNPQKTIIAPARWFKNSKANSKDIIPEAWIKI
jgi:hypothetical protein